MLYVGLGMLSYGCVQAITAPITTFLGSKYTGFGIIILVCGFLLSAFTFVLAYVHDSLAVVIVLLALIGGSCSGCNVSICSMVLDYTTPEDYGSISGSITLFQTLGSAIGSVAANQIRLSKYVMDNGMKVATDEGYQLTLTVMGAVLILTFVLSFVYPNKLQACRGKKGVSKEEAELMDPDAAISSTSVSPQPEIGLSSNSATPNPEEMKKNKKKKGGVAAEVKIDVNEESSSSSSVEVSEEEEEESSEESSEMEVEKKKKKKKGDKKKK